MTPPSELKLVIQPKVIDHLGIKMYQKPVDVISEYIANAWDADSESVNVKLGEHTITITDQGNGMTFQECQDSFLTVARDRRKATGKETSEGGRPLLGRKGIGKFAGFGVAKKVQVKTISGNNGELTEFVMDIDEILSFDALETAHKPIKIIAYEATDDSRKSNKGTTVILEGMNENIANKTIFIEELSRRFLLSQLSDIFQISVDEEPVPDTFETNLEYIFPRDLSNDEKSKLEGFIGIEDGWAKELFEGEEIKWRVGFYEEPIEIEELRGISIYVKNKVAQKPFFFDIVGGLSGQFGLEYMTGQVRIDFIDMGDNDLIATERQRINLQTPLGKKIREWGIARTKFLSSAWKSRRSEARTRELEDRLGQFKTRLDALPPEERKTVRAVLVKIASFERLGKQRFQDWCTSILTSWEVGTLRELIKKLSSEESLDQDKFLEILAEADVLTALNIAESIKTKITAIGELKERVLQKQHENKVRDYIYEHPWLIHPKWEGFKKERSVANVIAAAGVTILDKDEIFKGRVDLVLSAGNELLLLEFMRPGTELDLEHLHRVDDYVSSIKIELAKNTVNTKHLNNAYVVADSTKNAELTINNIRELSKKGIYIMSWNDLIEQALKQWSEHLELLKERNPGDTRIQAL